MASYTEVARVTNFADLRNVLTDVQLKSGDRVKVDIAVPWGSGTLFNVAGAEQVFSPFVPPSMFIVDVYETDPSTGTIEMQATSPPLAAVLAVIADSWPAILVGAVALGILAIIIVVSIKIMQTNPTVVSTYALIAVIALAGLWIISKNTNLLQRKEKS